MNFVNSFRSEWLKKKRSLTSWLVFVGAFFTPTIILTARLFRSDKLPALYAADDFWLRLWNQAWESMAILMLPIGIVLATGLIAQLEYKNNTWKQLHTTPQGFSTIFFAKFLVILVMLIEVFVLFNVGVYLAAIIPALLLSDVPYPPAAIPYAYFLNENAKYFIDCLPVLALQYLISLQFKNFLVPVGTGFVIWILSIGMLSWQYSFLFPFAHGPLDFLISSGNRINRYPPVNLQLAAALYFAVFTIAAYVFYITKKEKG